MCQRLEILECSFRDDWYIIAVQRTENDNYYTNFFYIIGIETNRKFIVLSDWKEIEHHYLFHNFLKKINSFITQIKFIQYKILFNF